MASKTRRAHGPPQSSSGRPGSDQSKAVACAESAPGSEFSSQPPAPPSGSVTFLFTDIEGSTRLWEQQPDEMRDALSRHVAATRAAIESLGGYVFKTLGDSFCSAFARADTAAAAALAIQAAGSSQEGDRSALRIRVRAALYSGDVEPVAGDYLGPIVNRTARLLAAGYGGQILVSQTTASHLSQSLPSGARLVDLGLHVLKDIGRQERVYQLNSPSLTERFPPLRSQSVRVHDLPLPLTKFIGRKQEIEAVRDLISSGRLVTLTGPGGCGKSRLGLEAASRLVTEFADSVWLVDLAGTTDAALVPQVVAAGLMLREEPWRPITETLIDAVRHKQLLLVLDNCCHIADACAALAERLLQKCPSLRILATSREVLRLPAEVVYRVPALSAPTSEIVASSADPQVLLSDYDAIRLFVDRATTADQRLDLSAKGIALIADICRRLDGMPLAIEIAAAQVRVLSLPQLAARLDDRFRLLASGRLLYHPHQETLQKTMDWSYSTLTDDERAMLCRLSVFAGTFGIDAVEYVSGLGQDAAAMLARLVDKSLVSCSADGEEARYHLLETVRQYVRAKLVEAGGDAEAVERHRDWYLMLAEQADASMGTSDQARWLAKLDNERRNLRAALQNSVERSIRLRIACALWQYWSTRGDLTEARAWLMGALALSNAVPTELRIRGIIAASGLALDQGDYGAARSLGEEALAISREAGFTRGIGMALTGIGYVERDQGNCAAANKLFSESLAIWEEIGDIRSIPGCLYSLGTVSLYDGDLDAAQSMFERALSSWRSLGSQIGIAHALNSLGVVAGRRGDPATACRLIEKSLSYYSELGHRQGASLALCNLADAMWRHGRSDRARAMLAESLEIRHDIGDLGGIADGLEIAADIASCDEAFAQAASLCAAADALRTALGVRLPVRGRQDHSAILDRARHALDAAAFEEAWARGTDLALDAIVEETVRQLRTQRCDPSRS